MYGCFVCTVLAVAAAAKAGEDDGGECNKCELGVYDVALSECVCLYSKSFLLYTQHRWKRVLAWSLKPSALIVFSAVASSSSSPKGSLSCAPSSTVQFREKS